MEHNNAIVQTSTMTSVVTRNARPAAILARLAVEAHLIAQVVSQIEHIIH